MFKKPKTNFILLILAFFTLMYKLCPIFFLLYSRSSTKTEDPRPLLPSAAADIRTSTVNNPILA